jgi:hypothetical protein
MWKKVASRNVYFSTMKMESDMFLRNVSWFSTEHTAFYSRRQNSLSFVWTTLRPIFWDEFCVVCWRLTDVSEERMTLILRNVKFFSETSIYLQHTTWRYILWHRSLHNHCCENLKSQITCITFCIRTLHRLANISIFSWKLSSRVWRRLVFHVFIDVIEESNKSIFTLKMEVINMVNSLQKYMALQHRRPIINLILLWELQMLYIGDLRFSPRWLWRALSFGI